MRLNYLLKKPRKLKKFMTKTLELQKSPQKKGLCELAYIKNPKKPNSAQRKVAKIYFKKGRSIIAYIPGEGHNLHQHSMVLIRGGKVKDLPGVKYQIIRGVYDLKAVLSRKTSRSKYGKKT